MTGSPPRWTDDHCHLPDDDTLPDVLAAARAAGVERLVHVGVDVDTSRRALAVAARHDGVWGTAGVHPHEARFGTDGLEDLLDDPWCVAVGECGLDYHYDHSPRDVQQSVFREQIRFAHAHDLPLVIHTREAWDDTFDVLDDEGMPERTVFHCFTGGPREARRCLDRGGYLSFSGIITFNAADDVRAAAELTPLDRVLVETDSPYLAPAPNRGKTNQPAWVPLVGAAVAEAGGHTVEAVAEASWANAAACYRLG